MKEFLEYLLKNLTKYPDDISIREETTEDGTLVYYLKVHPDDIGKVIGKGGKVIWSIRTLLRVRAQREGKRTLVKIEEPPPTEVPQEDTSPPTAKQAPKETQPDTQTPPEARQQKPQPDPASQPTPAGESKPTAQPGPDTKTSPPTETPVSKTSKPPEVTEIPDKKPDQPDAPSTDTDFKSDSDNPPQKS
jgi:predicted RNA-binding protein YlqC (UPF0109 family)